MEQSERFGVNSSEAKSSSTLSPKAVSEAISKIRSRHGGVLDIESICEDCLGKIVSAQGDESVCESYGRTYGHKEVNQTNEHSVRK
ncbi:MAG TPA: hypothetical protein VJN71_04420 [Nitrososphaerales archaeon]|nr:hypothetical protein [Nitrososphaerales archaeon]